MLQNVPYNCSSRTVLSTAATERHNLRHNNHNRSVRVAGSQIATIIGSTQLSLRLPTTTTSLKFDIINQAQNIIGWQTIVRSQLLKPYFCVNLIQQPCPPVFLDPMFDLIRRCSPQIPMRYANYEISTIGEYIPPRTPMHSPSRPMSSDKLRFLHGWMENMRKFKVISDSQLGDSHLVPELDKQHATAEGSYRITENMTDVN